MNRELFIDTPYFFLQVAQLQKQKKKAEKKAAAGEESKDSIPAEETPKEEKKDANETAEKEQPEQPEEPKEPGRQEKPAELPSEPMPDAPRSPGPEIPPESTKEDKPREGHERKLSLSAQLKMRSSSFRKSSISQGLTPPLPPAALKSPPLPPLTPDGDSVQEVYRKQAMRLEELEKENKRLEKELEEANRRWKKTEDELEDLREASGDVVELKDKLEKAEQKAAEVEKLVSYTTSIFPRFRCGPLNRGQLADLVRRRKSKSLLYSAKIRSSRAGHTEVQPVYPFLAPRNHLLRTYCSNWNLNLPQSRRWNWRYPIYEHN